MQCNKITNSHVAADVGAVRAYDEDPVGQRAVLHRQAAAVGAPGHVCCIHGANLQNQQQNM